MIFRTTNLEIIERAIEGHELHDFDARTWIDDFDNIALCNEYGDVNLFQLERPGVYFGHFFYQSRGNKALAVARTMLKEIFAYSEVKVLIGLTPVEHLGAKWLTKKLGFKSQGIVDTKAGDHEMFILTRTQYKERPNE